MVDPYQLTADIVGNTVSLLIPAGFWAILYLLAWEHAPFAESIGFGRRSFWLLLPGAILGSFGFLPIAPVSTDWVAVSLAGALFPLFVGLLAFGRAAPPRARSLSIYLALLAVEGSILFALVLPATAGLSSALGSSLHLSEYVGNEVVVLIAAAAFCAVVGALALASPDAPFRRVAFLLAITSGTLVMTFAAATAIPGVGITESFPFFLVPPIVAGLVAALFANRVFPNEAAFGIPTAFLGSTFGVLLGADLLRQPPLYGTGPSGLYTIGGAGVLDLVYISGLIGFATAYFIYWVEGRGWTPVGSPLPPSAPSPTAELARAFRSGVEGHLNESLQESAGASHAAAEQTRRLLGLPPATPDRPWQGLPVPGWMVADQANLDSSARLGTEDGREGFRAWRTAHWLVTIGREIGDRRYGTIRDRSVAFLIDLAIVTGPAVALWIAMLVTMHGGLVDALSNVAFNAAIFGFIAWAYFYFVLTETFLGTTLGKRLLSLEVRERSFTPPSGLTALVRNSTTLPLLTTVGIGVSIALAFGIKASSEGSVVLAGVSLPVGVFALIGVLSFVVGGIVLLGGGAVLLIAVTAERQRLGDLWAGTWVVRRLPAPPSATTGATPPAATGPAPPPPGVGRSG